MKCAWLYLFLVLLSSKTYSQINLVPNNGFEQFSTCPNSIGQINYSSFWNQPTTGTSDYYNSCYDTTIGDNYGEVPNNYFGYQNAKSGVAYSGVFAFDYSGPISSPTYREYIQAQLSSPLVMNQTYYVTIYVSLSDSSRYYTDDFGVYFSQAAISRSDFDAFGFIPQIENPSGVFLSDKNNWIKISGSFIALGNEQYITIGNFKNDSNTDTVKTIFNLPANADYDGAYYYIDDICVSTDSIACNGTVGVKEFVSNQALFYYNSSSKQIIINEKGVCQMQILDLYGNTKSALKLLGNQSVDVSAYEAGCYIIVFNNQNSSCSKKIIINP